MWRAGLEQRGWAWAEGAVPMRHLFMETLGTRSPLEAQDQNRCPCGWDSEKPAPGQRQPRSPRQQRAEGDGARTGALGRLSSSNRYIPKGFLGKFLETRGKAEGPGSHLGDALLKASCWENLPWGAWSRGPPAAAPSGPPQPSPGAKLSRAAPAALSFLRGAGQSGALPTLPLCSFLGVTRVTQHHTLSLPLPPQFSAPPWLPSKPLGFLFHLGNCFPEDLERHILLRRRRLRASIGPTVRSWYPHSGWGSWGGERWLDPWPHPSHYVEI